MRARKKEDDGNEEGKEAVRTKNENVIRPSPSLLPLGSPAAPFAPHNQGSS